VESGAEDAWRELVGRTRRLIALVVLRTARHWTEPAPALVEDLVQDTYLKLCEKQCRALREFQPHNQDALFSFLKVIAINVTNDHFKSEFAQKRRTEKVIGLNDAAELISDQSAGKAAMEQEVLFRQIDGLLCAPRTSAHPKDREIFWLYYRGGMSARAIAEIPAIGGGVKFVERRLARLTADVRDAVLPPENPEGEPS